jgi:hypothetical protein
MEHGISVYLDLPPSLPRAPYAFLCQVLKSDKGPHTSVQPILTGEFVNATQGEWFGVTRPAVTIYSLIVSVVD